MKSDNSAQPRIVEHCLLYPQAFDESGRQGRAALIRLLPPHSAQPVFSTLQSLCISFGIVVILKLLKSKLVFQQNIIIHCKLLRYELHANF